MILAFLLWLCVFLTPAVPPRESLAVYCHPGPRACHIEIDTF